MATAVARPLDDTAITTGTAGAYRPHLDGLRAVAVYLVVAFHAGILRFSGGFIGVDVFFVLSGYLVTQLLLRDIAGRGRIRLTSFYARRFRRLLPAAFVVLMVTTIVYPAIAAPSEVRDAIGAIKASFLYVANWFFIRQSHDYFGGDVQKSPVIHFWSLAVEEQFYLIWPLLLLGLYRVTQRARRQWNVIRLVVAAGCAASLVAALLVSRTNLNRAYYGTDTRMYQMLAGALLALSLGPLTTKARTLRWSRVIAALSLAALIVLATSVIDVGPIQRGVAAALAATLLILAIETSEGGRVKECLSLAPVTFLGRISYGTYLWHWLVILVAVQAFDPGPWALFAISALIGTSLASFSFQILERPVRLSKTLDRYRAPVIAVGLAISIVCALVVVPAILDPGSVSGTVAPTSAGGALRGTPIPKGLDWQRVKRERLRSASDCFGKPVDECIIVHGSGRTVAVIGDSHAEMLLPPLVAIAQREHWTLATLVWDACPWQDGLYRFTGELKDDCLQRKSDWQTRVIPKLDPDLVILVEAPLDKEGVKGLHLGGPDGSLETGSAAAEQAIERGTASVVERLRRDGRDVVLEEPIPQGPAGFDPLACVSRAKYVETCRFVTETAPSPIEMRFRQLDRADTHVWALDIDKLACPYLPICDPVEGGKIVWLDVSHLSLEYARTLIDPLQAYLHRNGIVGR